MVTRFMSGNICPPEQFIARHEPLLTKRYFLKIIDRNLKTYQKSILTKWEVHWLILAKIFYRSTALGTSNPLIYEILQIQPPFSKIVTENAIFWTIFFLFTKIFGFDSALTPPVAVDIDTGLRCHRGAAGLVDDSVWRACHYSFPLDGAFFGTFLCKRYISTRDHKTFFLNFTGALY